MTAAVSRCAAATAPSAHAGAFHAVLGRAAIAALYDELALEPKPGLVSFADAGSHDDMDAATFLRSLFALRHFFVRVAAQGADSDDFAPLEALGIEAETRMLRATGGVNTHRGAIFTLGLLCAAAGATHDAGLACDATTLRGTLRARWGAALAARAPRARHARRARGAPTACAAPPRRPRKACRRCSTTCCRRCPPRVPPAPTLAARGCTRLSRRSPRLTTPTSCIAAACRGCATPSRSRASSSPTAAASAADAPARAARVHAAFVERRLSPGGAADLLAAACWVERVERLAGAASR